MLYRGSPCLACWSRPRWFRHHESRARASKSHHGCHPRAVGGHSRRLLGSFRGRNWGCRQAEGRIRVETPGGAGEPGTEWGKLHDPMLRAGSRHRRQLQRDVHAARLRVADIACQDHRHQTKLVLIRSRRSQPEPALCRARTGETGVKPAEVATGTCPGFELNVILFAGSGAFASALPVLLRHWALHQTANVDTRSGRSRK